MSRKSASALTTIALALVAGTGATPVAAQPLDELPDFLAPDLPLGVEHLCAGPIVPDLPPGEFHAVTSASEELPPLPEWCDGTCVIDIAFFYDPEAIDGTRDGFPATVGELRARALAAIDFANVAFRRAGLDAELRFVGMERDPVLTKLGLNEASDRVQERLIEARQKYGADLVYAITETQDPSACGLANLRTPGTDREWAAQYTAVGAVWVPCLGWGHVFAHEVGHNLGLVHDPGRAKRTPFMPFGRGYRGTTRFRDQYASIMAPSSNAFRFSTSGRVYGRLLGDAAVNDAAKALRHTIPDATTYSPTVIPHKDDDPHGYGCRPSGGRACLNERRFDVSARYSTPTVSRAPAKRLDTYGLGDSGTLFYFFGPDNPEMLVKVVNGCWLNDHYWVFGSAATDLVYEVAIENRAAGGGTVEYRHNGGGVIVGENGYSTSAGVINDTRAFPCGRTSALQAGKRLAGDPPVVQTALQHEQGALPRIVAEETDGPSDYGCREFYSSSCLNSWRFGVRGSWQSSEHKGRARSLQSYGLGDSGALFYFFGADNPEMLLKVVNGCTINGHWWVFGSAATDLRYEIVVDDYATASLDSEGRVRIGRTNWYRHHGGGRITSEHGYSTRAGVINDTSAFRCNQ